MLQFCSATILFSNSDTSTPKRENARKYYKTKTQKCNKNGEYKTCAWYDAVYPATQGGHKKRLLWTRSGTVLHSTQLRMIPVSTVCCLRANNTNNRSAQLNRMPWFIHMRILHTWYWCRVRMESPNNTLIQQYNQAMWGPTRTTPWGRYSIPMIRHDVMIRNTHLFYRS